MKILFLGEVGSGQTSLMRMNAFASLPQGHTPVFSKTFQRNLPTADHGAVSTHRG
jgi:hypothetical protein